MDVIQQVFALQGWQVRACIAHHVIHIQIKHLAKTLGAFLFRCLICVYFNRELERLKYSSIELVECQVKGKEMKKYLIYIATIFIALNSFAQNNTTINFDGNTNFSKSIKFESFYLDQKKSLTAEEIVKLGDVYQNAEDLKNTEGQYWSKLEIKNTNNKDVIISINNKFWNKESELFLFTTTNELVKLDTSNFNGFNYSFKKTIGDATKSEVSRNVLFGMPKNSTLNLIIKHPSDFDPNSGDGFVLSNYKYKSEIDRGSIYIEGVLIGGILSIFIFSIFVALIYRDLSNILFCAWLLFSFISTLSDFSISDSGSRLGEFFVDLDNLSSPVKQKWFDDAYYYIYPLILGMSIFQVYVGSTLRIKLNYPKLYAIHLLLATIIYIKIFVIISHSTFSLLGSSKFNDINNYFNTQVIINMVSSYAQFAYQIFITVLCFDLLRRGNFWIIFLLFAMIVGAAIGPLLGFIYPYMSPFWELMGEILGIGSELAHSIAYPFFTLIQAIVLTCGVASRLKFSQTQLVMAKEENQKILIEQNQTLEVKVKERTHELHLESQKSERLMLNILPQSIATRLKAGDEGISDSYQNATILFSDLVGFTKMSSGKTAEELVFLLNDLFKRFDTRATSLGLEKIKTIGDAYMVAGGLPTNDDEHAIRVTKMALGMYEDLEAFNEEHGMELDMRIGINSGPVVAGVIGHSKFSYDLWGNTVNTASRMESTCLPGKVQVSPSTYEQIKEHFDIQENQIIECKGLGKIMTYFVRN